MMQLLHPALTQHSPWRALGTAGSVLCHGLLVGSVFLGGASSRREPGALTQAIVKFLIPPDRPAGGPDVSAGSIPWDGLQGRAGGDGAGTEGGIAPGTTPRGAPETDGEGSPATGEPSLETLYASLLGDSVWSELEVDSTVERDPTSAAPVYPAQLLADHVEGSAFVLYIVDSLGRVDTTTLRVVRATHPGFVTSVRQALARMKFRPALLRGHPVSQLVQQSFAFRIRPPTADSTSTPQRFERDDSISLPHNTP